MVSHFRVGSSGFSLLEALLGVGLFGITILGVVGLSDYSNKLVRRMEGQLAANQALETAFLVLQDAGNCNRTLGQHCDLAQHSTQAECTAGGGTWNPGQTLLSSGQSTVVSTVKSSQGADVISTGAPFEGGVTVERIEFANRPVAEGGIPDSGGVGLIQLRLLLRDKDGGLSRMRTVNLHAATAGPLPNQITNCIARDGMGTISNTQTYLVIQLGPGVPVQACVPAEANCDGMWVAQCNAGDLPIGGDCYQGDQYALNAVGKMELNVPVTADCSGCPTNPARCEAACLTAEYDKFVCRYYNMASQGKAFGAHGARVLCLRR